MLSVKNLSAGYGAVPVLFDMTFEVANGEVVTLIGRNGMGKTTTVSSIMGLLPGCTGHASFDGLSLVGLPPYRIAQAGIGLVPEGRQIFPTLTVEENLFATARTREDPPRWTTKKIFELFPKLGERRKAMGAQLSGGEQQMVAIGRALMTNPKLLILDEATEGLAPMICKEIWGCLAVLKAEGYSILVIDKNLDALLKFADRHVVVEKGHVAWSGTAEHLAAGSEIRRQFLQV